VPFEDTQHRALEKQTPRRRDFIPRPAVEKIHPIRESEIKSARPSTFLVFVAKFAKPGGDALQRVSRSFFADHVVCGGVFLTESPEYASKRAKTAASF
jgi:hypothetical protein